ncbi:origin recognition complex subunit 1 [Diprion similis]|uniref:origin recognition complex subunit 1 n=1 Tax=Diprion similis TaxID=362088 RepID=UPI001EF96711|nr:origin recognition complex subunit 1 [Diprion similis]
MTRSKNNLVQAKPTWLGVEKKCRKRNPFTFTCKTYEGFEFNGTRACVGDFVLVNADSDEPDTVEGCDVARIEHLFEHSTRKNDKHRANVQWFSKPNKLPESVDRDHIDEIYEVVEDHRKFSNNVSIETIYQKCHVIYAYQDAIPQQVHDENRSYGIVFVCRYRLCTRNCQFYIEPVLNVDDISSNPTQSKSCLRNDDVDKNRIKYMPNTIVTEELNGLSIKENTSQEAESRKEKQLVTSKSKSVGSKNTLQNRSTLQQFSTKSNSEASSALSPTRDASGVYQNSNIKNSPKATPRKNLLRSSRRSEAPLTSTCVTILRSRRDTHRTPSENDINDEVIESTPIKSKLNGTVRKRRASSGSNSGESLEPRSRSSSPEIVSVGPPATYKLCQLSGQNFIIKTPIDIQRKETKKLNDLDISSMLLSDDSDNEPIIDRIIRTGSKIVARSKSDDTDFELLHTPIKNVESLDNINENTQVETPKSARRNLSRCLENENSCDARKDLLLKKMAEKREDASLRIKLCRSSEWSNYKIDSDSDGSVNNKTRKRNVPSTPKSILKVNSKRPNTPSVHFDNHPEINEYSPISNLTEKLIRVEIKLDRVDSEHVRKSSRDRKLNSKYSDGWNAASPPSKKTDSKKVIHASTRSNETLTKRSRRTSNSSENNDDPDFSRVSLRPRTRSLKYSDHYADDSPSPSKKKTPSKRIRENVNYNEEANNDYTNLNEKEMSCTMDKMEWNDCEVVESNEENDPNGTPRMATSSKYPIIKGSNKSRNVPNDHGILTDKEKALNVVSKENNNKTSIATNKNEDLKLMQTPRRSRRTLSTHDDVSTPDRRSGKLDHKEIEPKTPRRSVTAPKLQTPSKSVKTGLLTPSMRQRNISISQPSTPLQEARARLHVSAIPKSLPCREEEFNNIYTFLEGKLTDNSGGCLYISGVPGAGKTATVNEVIRCLRKSVSKNKLDHFEFIAINGMKLTEPRQAYVEILKQLTGKKATWEQAHELLDKRFTRAAPRRLMTLLLIDELDILCNKRQDVVYNLLDWPAKSTAQLVVITIANTMDLPERVLMGRVTSRLGLTRLTFQPYTHKQLQEIVVARLNDSNAFKSEAIQLVARKVAAVSGDARRALDICRRATELAEVNRSDIVSIQDVNEALTEMIASPKVQAIRHCSEMEQMFLQSVCAEVGRTGVEEVVFKNIYSQLISLCSLEGLKVPTVTEAIIICAKLGASRLLICEHSRADIHQRVLLNISSDDVHFAMRITDV